MAPEAYKIIRELIAVIITFIIALIIIILGIKHTRRSIHRMMGATFKTEMIQDRVSGKSQFKLESSKYAEDGDYHILFEVAGETATTVTDEDGKTYQSWLTESITKKQTYTYAISGCSPGIKLLKVTIIGNSFCKSYFIPFEVPEEK